MSERILIEGIGGIGGVVAARMAQAGYPITLLTNNPNITKSINSGGLRINSPEGLAVVRCKAYTHLDDLPTDEPFDAAYLIMKANNVVQAAAATRPLLKPDGYVVTFQNGIVEDAVSTVIEPERIVSAIVGWGGTMHAPGVYERTTTGATHIGELDGSITPRLQHLEAALENVAPVVVTQNIRGALWAKLAINCTITTIGGFTGELLGDMMQDKQTRLAFIRAYAEVIDTAEKLGVTPEKIAANPKALYVAPDNDGVMLLIKDQIVRFVGRKYGRIKSSILQSLERGRPTEIDYLNGYVVEQARPVGVPTPVNARIVQLIKEIEAGTRSISPQNLDDLLEVLA
jgi:2-dehydropantoate 2-reductase